MQCTAACPRISLAGVNWCGVIPAQGLPSKAHRATEGLCAERAKHATWQSDVSHPERSEAQSKDLLIKTPT